MDDKNKIIEKIRKLLALAEGNRNEKERDVAMKFAQDLLSKHNLDVAQLDGQYIEISVTEFDTNFRLERWVKHLLDAVTLLYYTDYYISNRNTGILVGTAENVAVSVDVAAWLIKSIRSESNRLYKEPHERRSFRLGASFRLHHRAYQLVTDEKCSSNNKTSGTSLVVVRNQLQKANDDYLASLDLRQTTRRPVFIDRNAYDRGSSFGDGVALGKQVKRIPLFV